MKFTNLASLISAFVLSLLIVSTSMAQVKTQSNEQPGEKGALKKPAKDAEEKNLQAYIDLLRRDVRQQKAEIMGAVMLLSADDASKFWPLYTEYDSELTKLNNQRIENIKDYGSNYTLMTNEKADELIQKSLTYQRQRSELFAKTYESIKQSLGAITAARFAQVENQLLMLIDLQIASSLPIVGEGS